MGARRPNNSVVGTDKIRSEVMQREGSEAIYRESGLIAHVRIHGLSINDHSVGGTATLVQPAITFGTRATRLVSVTNDWTFSSALDGFSVSSLSWGCAYPIWTIYFDEELIRTLSEQGFRAIENCEVSGARQADRFREFIKVIATAQQRRWQDDCFSK
jgi:hypothetical protein